MSFPHFPDFPHGRPYAILVLSHGRASKASVVIEFCPRPAFTLSHSKPVTTLWLASSTGVDYATESDYHHPFNKISVCL